MATITPIELLETVRSKNFPQATERQIQAIDAIIEPLIQVALEKVGRIVANSAEYNLLQKEFTVTPVLGVADLTTIATTGEDTILFDTIKSTGFLRETTDTTNQKGFIRKRRYQSLYSSKLTPGVVYYYIGGDKKVYFREGGAAMAVYVSPLTLTASVIPTIGTSGNLPPQFEGILVDVLTQMVGEKGGVLIAPDDAPLGVETLDN